MPEEKKEIYKSNYRHSFIHSCSLDKEDLKKLCKKLEEKLNECVEIEVSEFRRPEKMTNEEFEKVKEAIKKNLKLSVQIIGKKGKQIIGQNFSVFDEVDFPEDLDLVVFSNSFPFKFFFGYEPRNIFEIRLRFFKDPILNLSNPREEPSDNSSVKVFGSNESWVTATYHGILSFFEDKKRNRSWLHKKHIYDLFLFLFILPATFWIIFRIDNYISLLNTNISTVLSIAIYFYIFFLILFFFRILFNYVKWVFPLVEFSTKEGTKMSKHRRFLWTLIVGIIGGLILDILRTLL